MIPEPTPLSITPMERFTLRRIQAGTYKHSGARFAYHARSDGWVMYAVTAADFSWSEAGSAKTLAEAQRAVEAAIAFRKQASVA